MVTIKQYSVLGCPVEPFKDEVQVKNCIKELVESHFGGYSVAINATKIYMYEKDVELKTIINNAALLVPDGSGATLGLKFLYGKSSIRVDLPRLTLETANENSYSLFVLGASNESNSKAIQSIKQRYPDIQRISGRDGFFESYEGVFKEIKEFNPNVIMIAMGSPRQEKLARKLLNDLPEMVFINCGGAVDILAGAVKRAPEFYQRNHLEWFYRLLKQPSRIRRQLVLPLFMIKLFLETVKIRIRK